jgi:hypothetical protein
MAILINNMKIIHTSTFTIIHTNFNHYLETTQRKQREIIIRIQELINQYWTKLKKISTLPRTVTSDEIRIIFVFI